MTTFTATANLATGAVDLALVQTKSIVSITRASANGSAQVRAAAGQLPTATTGTTLIADYEGAQGLNTYTAYHADGTTETASASLALDKPWLLVPIAPNYSEQVETITNYSAGRDTHSTVHQIIGRPDPIVVMGKLGTRRGTLEIFTVSLADAARVTRVFDRGEVVLLKQTVPGLDMYLAALAVGVEPYNVDGAATRWKLTVDYQEVTRPQGNLAGALGWTYDALALAYPSYSAALADFASYDDLTLEDTIS